MKWFEGPIPAAINSSKATNSIFIVYVTGEDEQSKQMDSTWEDQTVMDLCQQEKFVAVKINAHSDECGFFSQIYPVVVVPSTFFIGTNGVPLEVTGGYLAPSDFTEKIGQVVQIFKNRTPPVTKPEAAAAAPPAEPVTASQPSAEIQTVPPPSQQAKTSSPPSEPGGTAAAAAPETPEPATSVSEESSEAKKPKLDKDTKVQLAKDLIEQKRIDKMKKEKEENQKKELERIKAGRDVQKLKQFQKDREILETQNQIKKDREEDRKARERVKEQIARDRAERAARFNKEKEAREKVQEEAKRVKLMAQQQAAAEAEAKRSETARLQFRLPDGSAVNTSFPSGEPLQNAYNFASQHLGCSVSLSTTFPRRTFSESDMSKSFKDLQLAPSAVIMVVPGQRPRSSGGGGGGGSAGSIQTTGILGLILSPFVFVFNILRALFSSFTSPSPSAPPDSTTQETRPSATGGERKTDAYQRRGVGRGAGVSRTEGNVHRFQNADDEDDDENATWNGNSTQQM